MRSSEDTKPEMPITVFMFGYFGWGNATNQLLEAVDVVERERGFKPPIFVDIRISRRVRAKGFSGNAFEELVGEDRYRWMKSLGNEKFKEKDTGNGRPVKIAEPEAASDLLDLAVKAADDQRRVIFFCSCPFPKDEGKIACHRWNVGDLLLKGAEKRRMEVEVVEWPGGESDQIELNLSSDDFGKVAGGRKNIPAGNHLQTEYGGIPWASVADIHSGDEMIHRVVGPAIFRKQNWVLPVLWGSDDPEKQRSVYEREGQKLRRCLGVESRKGV